MQAFYSPQNSISNFVVRIQVLNLPTMDNYAFSWHMRLKSHFSGFPDTRAPEKYPEFVEKSDWQPPKQGRDLETFISSVESDIAKHKPPIPKHDNLKPSERSALHSLQKREDIIIKPADKGSAVFHTITKKHYIPESTFIYQKALRKHMQGGMWITIFMCVG